MLKYKVIGLAFALVLIAALVAVASGATGAYFSDTKDGNISGQLGTIKISAGKNVDTGGGLSFNWDNMLPGVPYSATIFFQNTGSNPQDVYLTFPNLTALSALNTLGRYGAVHISVNDVEQYVNANLNDIPNNGTEGLAAQILLVQSLAPNATGKVTFTFEYATALKTQEPGGVFNLYPIPFTTQDPRYPAGQAQMVVRTIDGTGDGLPFNIVATQVGIQPGDTGSKF